MRLHFSAFLCHRGRPAEWLGAGVAHTLALPAPLLPILGPFPPQGSTAHRDSPTLWLEPCFPSAPCHRQQGISMRTLEEAHWGLLGDPGVPGLVFE